jgi:hypothetical protein
MNGSSMDVQGMIKFAGIGIFSGDILREMKPRSSWQAR